MIDSNGDPVDDMTLAYNRRLWYELESSAYTTVTAFVPYWLRTIQHMFEGLSDDGVSGSLNPNALQDEGIASAYNLVDSIENASHAVEQAIHSLQRIVPMKYKAAINGTSTPVFNKMVDVIRHHGSQPEQ